MTDTAPFTGRVLYVARAPFVSGAERALVTMLRHLDRTRVEPMLVLGCETKLVDIAASLDIPVTIVPTVKRELKRAMGWWRSLHQLSRVVERFKPQVMHANDVPSCQALSVIGGRTSVPRVVHVRWTITAREVGWWARAGAEAVLCISHWIEDQLGSPRGTPIERARIEVLHDAVDWPATDDASAMASHSDPPPLQGGAGGGLGARREVMHGDAARSTLPQPLPKREGGSDAAVETALGARPVIGFTGQLIESKGLDLVIEAMGRLAVDERPRLLVAGEDTQAGGAYKRQLQDLAERRGVTNDIEWLGFLDDVSDLHRRVTAMVCPSRVEPLGLVPLEAARLSVPTVASGIGGLAETIVDGETGYLVEPNVEPWAEALKRLRDGQTMARLGRAAYERMRTHFSPSVYQQRLMSLYGALTA